MLSARGLSKKYGDFTAVFPVSLDLREGETVILAGPNGSGKSTLLSMMAFALKPDEGQVDADGLPPKEARKRIAYAPQEITLFEELSTIENLKAWSSLSKAESIARAEELIEALDMEQFRKKRVGKLSGGQRRRVNLAAALMCHPQYILLDEPLAGIDPDGSEKILALLRKEREKGAALLVTEHVMRDLITFADRMITLSGGRIVSEEDLRG